MLVRRFLAVLGIGCLLLLIYQVVFMARTSAARDLNHIRATPLTTQQVERFVLHNVNESRIDESLAHIALNKVGRDELLLTRHRKSRISRLSHPPAPTYVESIRVDGRYLPVSPYAGLFRVAKYPEAASLLRGDVFTVRMDPRVSIDSVVDYALREGFQAVVYVVPSDWTPKFGIKEYSIPVVPSLLVPPRQSHEIRLGMAKSEHDIIERTFAGHSHEAILVSESKSSPESLALFSEMIAMFDLLEARGWRPYRTIRFISFPHYETRTWALQNEKWIRDNAAVYIDTSASRGISSSPLLTHTLKWALDTLKDGGLVSDDTPWARGINPPAGSNVFELDLQIPSISSMLTNATNGVRMLNLIVASLASEPALPFVVSNYNEYVNSSGFDSAAARFDAHLEQLKFEFTREYPWYQAASKLGAVVELKRANARLRNFEKQLRGADGTNVVFPISSVGENNLIEPSPSELAEVVEKLLSSEFLEL